MDNRLIFLLLFGLASASSTYLPNGCPADFRIQLLLPHESDCRLYYMCSNGQKYLFQCPWYTLFDFYNQVCDWEYNVNCQKQTTTTATGKLPGLETLQESSESISDFSESNTESPHSIDLISDYSESLLSTESLSSEGSSEITTDSTNEYESSLDFLETTPKSPIPTELSSDLSETIPKSPLFIKSTKSSEPTLTALGFLELSPESELQSNSLKSTTNAPEAIKTTSQYSVSTQDSLKSIEPVTSTIDVIEITQSARSTESKYYYETAPDSPSSTESSKAFDLIDTPHIDITHNYTNFTKYYDTEPSELGDSSKSKHIDSIISISNFSPFIVKNMFIFNAELKLPTSIAESNPSSSKSLHYSKPKPHSKEYILDYLKTTANLPEPIADSYESTLRSTEDMLDQEFLPNGCPVDIHINLLLPHETDCSKFYQCAHGNKVLQQCPAQLHFDTGLQVCNWAHSVDCRLAVIIEPTSTTTETTTTSQATTIASTIETLTETTTTPTTKIPSTNQPTTKVTTESTVTDFPTTAESVYVTTTESTNSTEPVTVESVVSTTEILPTIEPITSLPTTVKPAIDLTTVDSNEDDIGTTTIPALTTVKGNTEHETTQETTTQLYETTADTVTATPSTPELIEQATTTESLEAETAETDTGLQICPEGYFGNVAHPERCDAYYSCADWQPVLSFCPKGLEFDILLEVCVPVAKEGCTWYLTSSTTQASSTTDIFTTEAFETTENSRDFTTESVAVTTAPYSTTAEYTWTTPNNIWTTPNSTQEGSSSTSESVTDKITTETETWFTTDSLSPQSTTLPSTTVTEDSVTDISTVDSTTTVTTESYETTQEMETTPQICPDGFFGNVAHPDRCDAYYLCSGWTPILLFCPNGFEFDPVTRVCVTQEEGRCTWHQTSTSASTESTVTVEMITESTSGISENPVTIEMTTELESAPSENPVTTELPKTTTQYPVTIEITTEINIAGNSTGDFTLPSTYTTLKYTTTEYSESTEDHNGSMETQSTTHLYTEDPATAITTTEKQVATNNPEEITENPTSIAPATTDEQDASTTAPLCPDGYFGTVPDPNNCQGYYLCSGWNPIPLFCPSGFEFDPNLGTCVAQSEAGCSWLQTTTLTITEYISTDSSTQGNYTTESLTTTPYEKTTWEPTTQYITTEDAAETVQENTEYSSTYVPVTASTVANDLTPITDPDKLLTTTNLPEPTTNIPELTTNLPQPTTNVPEPVPEPTTNLPEITEEVPICPDGFFGLVADPTDCTAYYMCSGWMPIPLRCPSGFEFDITVQVCVFKQEGGCTWYSTSTVQPAEPITESALENVALPQEPGVGPDVEAEPVTEAPEICPPGFFGMVENPDDCTAYFLCSGWAPIPMICPSGFEFNPVVERCVQSSGLGCRALLNISPLKIIKPASAFYNQKHIPRTSKIRYENKIKPIGNGRREKKEIKEMCSPGFKGFQKDYRRCDGFFFCTGGEILEMYCSPGTEFDETSKRCVPIADNGCNARKESEKD